MLSYRHEKQLVTASQDMLNLLNRLGLYKQRSVLLCEVLKQCFLAALQWLMPFSCLSRCQGSEYQLGDFVVRLCRAILKPGDEVRGLMLDLEYISPDDGQEVQQALEASSLSLQFRLHHDALCSFDCGFNSLSNLQIPWGWYPLPVLFVDYVYFCHCRSSFAASCHPGTLSAMLC